MINMYQRTIRAKIEENLFQGKIIIIYGARQVGKTTLTQSITSRLHGKKIFHGDCQDRDLQERLEEKSIQNLAFLFKGYDVIVLDEAQEVREIGSILKLLHDHFPEIQVIATGSSSFELANKIGEPLVGRAKWFTLYPLSLREIQGDSGGAKIDPYIDTMLRYGTMPGIYRKREDQMEDDLNEMVESYLYKDILSFEDVKKASKVIDLLKVIALQIGSEVSLNEIANHIRLNQRTVEKYLDLLEKVFIIQSVSAFSNNPRNEIKNKKKYYFYDLGVRNALIRNHNMLEIRNDIGQLWENFVYMELIKSLTYSRRSFAIYFWRNYQGQEVDFVYQVNNSFQALECKFQSSKTKIPTDFGREYPEIPFEVVTRKNYQKLLQIEPKNDL